MHRLILASLVLVALAGCASSSGKKNFDLPSEQESRQDDVSRAESTNDPGAGEYDLDEVPPDPEAPIDLQTGERDTGPPVIDAAVAEEERDKAEEPIELSPEDEEPEDEEQAEDVASEDDQKTEEATSEEDGALQDLDLTNPPQDEEESREQRSEPEGKKKRKRR